MQATAREQRIVAPGEVGRWRTRLADRPDALALVTGTFDILQPGNWSALRHAGGAARHVGVVLESDPLAAGHCAPGRPQHDVVTRAEMLSYLRGITLITSVAAEEAEECFRALCPYTWITCRDRGAAEPLDAHAQRWAARVVVIPPVPGCSTEEIHESIRRGSTPVRLPAGWRGEGWSADDCSTPGALVTVNGCFDILHIGHLRLLEQARALGDSLVVLINDDDSVRRYKGPTRPIFPLVFRRAVLRGLEAVDGVCPFAEDTPLSRLREFRPAVHVKGGSYEPDRVREEEALLASWSGKVVCLPMVAGFSTSEYIRRALRGAARRSEKSDMAEAGPW